MSDLVPYELTLEARDGYLYARIECERLTETASVDYLTKIKARCEELGFSWLMIERRVPHVAGTLAQYSTANYFIEAFGKIKTAWVNPYPENHETLTFALTVAKNRGAPCALFQDPNEAEAWLLMDPDKRRDGSRDADKDRCHAWLG